MHLISAAAPRAAQAGIPHSVSSAIVALIAAAVVVIVLKVLARILSPRKPQGGGRPSSPYASTRK